MLSEFVESIVKLADNAAKLEKVELPGGMVLVRDGTGISEKVQKDREKIPLAIADYDSFTLWCEAQQAAQDLGELRVLIGRRCLSGHAFPGLFNAQAVGMNYRCTAAMEDLHDWCEQPRSLREVVTALRTNLAGCFAGDYLAVFRRMDFSRKNDGTKTVSHKGESLGRSVESLAQSAAGEIPETLVFTLSVFDNIPCEPSKLTFALDVDASTETIRIAPVADCIRLAKASVLVQLRGRLDADIATALVLQVD